MQAYTSVVFTLNAEDYEGGLYIMANYSAGFKYPPLLTGDALVHQADLLHGVYVARGDRWSWSLWIKPKEDCEFNFVVKGNYHKADADNNGKLNERDSYFVYVL